MKFQKNYLEPLRLGSKSVNTFSLSKNFEDFEYLLKSTNINYNIITISETRTMKNLEITKNIYLKNCNFEYTTTKSTVAGTMLYIANQPAYKPRHDLKIYRTNELKSTSIELTNLKKKNRMF